MMKLHVIPLSFFIAFLSFLSCSPVRMTSVRQELSAGVEKPQQPAAHPRQLSGQYHDAVYDYIDNYSQIAVKQMKMYGVPASITLAQGILESDAGRSTLATQCNNHFGIKCHSDWTGKTMRKDDDRKQECFRCYSSAKESFEDHSLFLVNGSRYRSLFELKGTDYKGWAKGLKSAGYATNPKYADKLIELIERYGLDAYDKGYHKSEYAGEQKTDIGADGAAPVGSSGLSGVVLNNRCRCIRYSASVSLKEISRLYDIPRYQLRYFNEIDRKTSVPDGTLLYLEKKKMRADKEHPTHLVKENETLWSISQEYGVLVKRLYKRNSIGPDNPVRVGMALKLR